MDFGSPRPVTGNALLYFAGPPMWSCGQSSWLQIHRSLIRFSALSDFLRNSGSGTESTQAREEPLERRSSGSGIENREYSSRDTSRWLRGKLYPQKLALTSPTSRGRSVGTVRSRTQATEFSLGSGFCFLEVYPWVESLDHTGGVRTTETSNRRVTDEHNNTFT
jgi:hypothetical protein